MKINPILRLFFSNTSVYTLLWSVELGNLNTICAENFLHTSRSSPPGKPGKGLCWFSWSQMSWQGDGARALCPHKHAFHNQCTSCCILSWEGCSVASGPSILLWIRQALFSLPGKGASIAPCLREPTCSGYLFTSEHLMGLPDSLADTFSNDCACHALYLKSHGTPLQLVNKHTLFPISFW